MSQPATSSQMDEIKKLQQQQAAAEGAKMVMGQSAQRFGNSLQFPNGQGTSASAMDADRKKRNEEETTYGELRRKYGI